MGLPHQPTSGKSNAFSFFLFCYFLQTQHFFVTNAFVITLVCFILAFCCFQLTIFNINILVKLCNSVTLCRRDWMPARMRPPLQMNCFASVWRTIPAEVKASAAITWPSCLCCWSRHLSRAYVQNCLSSCSYLVDLFSVEDWQFFEIIIDLLCGWLCFTNTPNFTYVAMLGNPKSHTYHQCNNDKVTGKSLIPLLTRITPVQPEHTPDQSRQAFIIPLALIIPY